jgi:hypothetical protein
MMSFHVFVRVWTAQGGLGQKFVATAGTNHK